jgi:hypothetical protein
MTPNKIFPVDDCDFEGESSQVVGHLNAMSDEEHREARETGPIDPPDEGGSTPSEGGPEGGSEGGSEGPDGLGIPTPWIVAGAVAIGLAIRLFASGSENDDANPDPESDEDPEPEGDLPPEVQMNDDDDEQFGVI